MRANWPDCCGPGELTPVYIPEATDEAIRDLCRARTDAVDDRRRSRHRLKGFLLRHGYHYQGKTSWSAAHQRYLGELGEVDRFAHPRQVMAYLGLVPTENTSNDKRRQGRITKCGNAHAR